MGISIRFKWVKVQIFLFVDFFFRFLHFVYELLSSGTAVGRQVESDTKTSAYSGLPSYHCTKCTTISFNDQRTSSILLTKMCYPFTTIDYVHLPKQALMSLLTFLTAVS